MCAVSVTVQYMIDNVPIKQWTPSKFAKFELAISLLERLDTELGQPDCLGKDKQAYLKDVRSFLYP